MLLDTNPSRLVLQYGLVTFFVAAFPLAPLISLLNNLIELRLDAYKLMRNYRRPVPRRLSGLGAWKGILQAITYISTVTNVRHTEPSTELRWLTTNLFRQAFVIGFTSDFVPRQIYRLAHNGKLVGYTNKTFSSKEHNRRLNFCFIFPLRFRLQNVWLQKGSAKNLCGYLLLQRTT